MCTEANFLGVSVFCQSSKKHEGQVLAELAEEKFEDVKKHAESLDSDYVSKQVHYIRVNTSLDLGNHRNLAHLQAYWFA